MSAVAAEAKPAAKVSGTKPKTEVVTLDEAIRRGLADSPRLKASSAAEAARWGLINQVVPDGTVLDAALALAERVTVNAPLSVQASKRIAYGADDGVIPAEEPAWARTAREFSTLLRTEDAKEGPLAFAEKRRPIWKSR